MLCSKEKNGGIREDFFVGLICICSKDKSGCSRVKVVESSIRLVACCTISNVESAEIRKGLA